LQTEITLSVKCYAYVFSTGYIKFLVNGVPKTPWWRIQGQ